MNVILEVPDTIEKASLWAMAGQIRDLRHIRCVVCINKETNNTCPGFEEIWIESMDMPGYEMDGQAAVRQLSMIVRDWVATGARLRLRGDVIIEL